MNKSSNFKVVKVMKSTIKTGLNHLLLSITFNDKHQRSQLGFRVLSVQHNYKGHDRENKFYLGNTLLLLLGL